MSYLFLQYTLDPVNATYVIVYGYTCATDTRTTQELLWQLHWYIVLRLSNTTPNTQNTCPPAYRTDHTPVYPLLVTIYINTTSPIFKIRARWSCLSPILQRSYSSLSVQFIPYSVGTASKSAVFSGHGLGCPFRYTLCLIGQLAVLSVESLKSGFVSRMLCLFAFNSCLGLWIITPFNVNCGHIPPTTALVSSFFFMLAPCLRVFLHSKLVWPSLVANCLARYFRSASYSSVKSNYRQRKQSLLK